MTWRRSVTLTVAAALLLTACTDKDSKQPEGQQVTIVAGGGTNPTATRATDLDLSGIATDLEVGRDGTVRLLTVDDKQAHIWQFRRDGSAQRIDLDPSISGVSQLAVADDGTLYVSSSSDGVGLVLRIASTGAATRVVGNGKKGITADGSPAADNPASFIKGVTVDHEGRLVYSEILSYGKQVTGVVRRVGADGRIVTIAGHPGALSEEEYSRGITASVAPPDGTKALSWPLPGLLQLNSLATGDGGEILLQANRGVLSVTPDGLVKAIARRRDAAAAPIGDRPFTREGDAVDADPRFIEKAGITANGGYVSMPVDGVLPNRETPVPAAFRWAGTYTPTQQAILDAAVQLADTDNVPPILRLVRPDGSVTTAAWPVIGGAVRDGRVYLLVQGSESKMMIGVLNLPG